jgi:hypothetical protein
MGTQKQALPSNCASSLRCAALGGALNKRLARILPKLAIVRVIKPADPVPSGRRKQTHDLFARVCTAFSLIDPT